MLGEIWTYKAIKPNDGNDKSRPVLILGDDSNNQLKYVDLHYVIISSSASCGQYDVVLDESMARSLGLSRASTIKTTKIYTGPKSKLGAKISELPPKVKKEFIEKYKEYQFNIITQFQTENENDE